MAHFWCQRPFFFPFFSALSALGLVVVMVMVWRRNYRRIVFSPINRAFGLLASLLILTCILAEDSTAAWLGLANFLPFFALFVALRNLIVKTNSASTTILAVGLALITRRYLRLRSNVCRLGQSRNS